MADGMILERVRDTTTDDSDRAGDRAGDGPRAARYSTGGEPAAPRFPTEFLGMDFDCADPLVALERIVSRPADAPFAYVVTPNVDHVVRLQCARSDLWPAYRHAWLTLCDSRILARLAARACKALPVTTGSDLTVALFAQGLRQDDRIAVVGGDPAMIDMLRARHGLTNLVHHNPPMRFIQDPVERLRAVNFVVAARARYTFLAIGSPQQEILAYHILRSGEAVGTGLCIGASLEFVTNVKARAPRLVQALSLEWLFRLGTDPARLWRRYLLEGPLIFSIFRRWHRLEQLTA